MARPLDDNRRSAILAAAEALIAEHGTGASTADIAKRAGVPSGSVFTYFSTKADLLNALYLELKTELTELVLVDLPEGDTKAQLRHIWMVWTRWGAADPVKRKALAHLTVSDLVTAASRQAAMKLAAPTIGLVADASARGSLKDVPSAYVGALVESAVYTTIDFMIAHPHDAERVSESGYEALWKMLT